jgi:hypothetical protein
MAARARAKQAPNASARRGKRQEPESINWPLDDKGEPMAQISFTASELIPTGDYANVVVGPVTVTKFVPDQDLGDKLNELAETVEADCIAEQRGIVLSSIQADVEVQSDSKKS